MPGDHLLQPLKAVIYGWFVEGYNRTETEVRSITLTSSVTRVLHAYESSAALGGEHPSALSARSALRDGFAPFLVHIRATIVSDL